MRQFLVVRLKDALMVRLLRPGKGLPMDVRIDLWSRCWKRIRTWRLPPLWAARDWYEETRAQGALAECLARREFDPGRGVPLDAFLYRRVVNAAWTRYRQEWSFGRRAVPQEVVQEKAPARPCPDPSLREQMAYALDRLNDAERRLLCRLFWDGSSLEDLSGETGLQRDALKKRKARALLKLREILQESDLNGERSASTTIKSEVAFSGHRRRSVKV